MCFPETTCSDALLIPFAENVRNFMGGGGVLYNYPDLKVEKPCDECVLLSLSECAELFRNGSHLIICLLPAPGLEYPDGKNANVDTGMWLHHVNNASILGASLDC